ncbi:MAG: tetratricopeptide repeat protein [Sphingomonadales bacterium]
MAEQKSPLSLEPNKGAFEKIQQFWANYNKPLSAAALVVVVVIAGWFAYQQLYQQPREAKAVEAMFRAEEYYRKDSASLALNGDGQNLGFLKVMTRYSGTDAANLARFYAGSCYIKLGENAKAIEMLEKFSTSSKGVQARAYKLLGDALADSGKKSEALSAYKNAAYHFEKDEVNSPEYLFMAAYFADQVLQDSKEAVKLYEEIREKYPRSQQSYDAEKYLARLGIYQSAN